MTPVMMKAFLDELSKIEDKPVSKELNKLLFRKSEEEVLMEHPELQPPPPPAPAPPADQGPQTHEGQEPTGGPSKPPEAVQEAPGIPAPSALPTATTAVAEAPRYPPRPRVIAIRHRSGDQ